MQASRTNPRSGATGCAVRNEGLRWLQARQQFFSSSSSYGLVRWASNPASRARSDVGGMAITGQGDQPHFLTPVALGRVAAQAPGHFVAVQSGKADVHDHDVRPPLDRGRQAVWAGVSILHAVAPVPQRATEHHYQVAVVIDH